MNSVFLSALVFAALCAVGLSELCTPDQWEGGEGSMGGYDHHGRPGIIREYSRIAYDAKNKRKAVFLTYINNDYMNKFQMIVRYGDHNDDTGMAYVVDLKEGKCWTKTLKRPFRKACIPDDAKHLGDFSLGLKDGGLKVSSYEVKKKGFSVNMSVQKKGDVIIPVTETIVGAVYKTHFIQGIGFMDITAGITNQTVFDVPKQCKEMEDKSITEFLMREHHILAI